MTENYTELSESLEDYLEIILDLETSNKVARAKDIAEKMDVKRGSVTSALKSLEKKGLINYEPYSFITLTKKGRDLAKEISRCHLVLKDFFSRLLKLPSEKADAIACRIEHAFDKETLSQFSRFVDFIDTCPRTGEDWIKSFEEYCAPGNRKPEDCQPCIKKCETRYLKERI